MTTTLQDKMRKFSYPENLTPEEREKLLKKAEELWAALEGNNLGGFSGYNRPFLILCEFKEVIEEFGRRDVGQQWSFNALKAAQKDALASLPTCTERELVNMLDAHFHSDGFDNNTFSAEAAAQSLKAKFPHLVRSA